MRLILAGLLAVAGCATTNPTHSKDTARQINRDHRYSKASDGQIVAGPSRVDQVVVGQRDAAGNVHVTTDRWFLSRADDLACAQMSMARLAQERASDPGVRQLAQNIYFDQQRLDRRIRDEAHARRVKLEAGQPSYELEQQQRLSSLSGPDFDREYVRTTYQLQAQQLALWNDTMNTADDHQIAQLAFQTQPLVRGDHAQAARELDRM